MCHLIGRHDLLDDLLQRESVEHQVVRAESFTFESHVYAPATIEFARPHVVLGMSCFGRHMIDSAHQ